MVSTISLKRRHLTLGYVWRSPARLLAFGFGIGLCRWGPGTLASLLTVPLYRWLSPHWSSQVLLVVLAAALLAGAWACGQAGRDIGVADHSGMVWDEVVAMGLILVFIPGDWMSQIMGFALFRLFDIWKPGPVRYVDQHMKGGLGVMLDDLVAALLVLLCFTAWKLLGAV